MTTILASAPLGLMVSDSSISDGDRIWLGPKVTRWRGELIGLAGEVDAGDAFLKWYKQGKAGKLAKIGPCHVLVLSERGLEVYRDSTEPEKIRTGVDAVGTGAKAAMAVFESQGWTDPQRAVRIVCNHDAGSRRPVRTYRLRKQDERATPVR
jgi:hypothetical protein